MPPLPLVQGTLDLLVLRTLASGPMHGHGVATAVHHLTEGDLAIEDAALYQALHRLDRQGLVEPEWRQSENNRRARYYAPTGGATPAPSKPCSKACRPGAFDARTGFRTAAVLAPEAAAGDDQLRD